MSIYMSVMIKRLIKNYWLVFRNKSLHHCPSDEVSNGADAENNHVYMTGPATTVFEGELVKQGGTL